MGSLSSYENVSLPEDINENPKLESKPSKKKKFAKLISIE